MRPNLLILGGTTEATALAKAVAEAGIAAQVSLAGRVARPKRQPLPQRIGGFGGVTGLAAFLRDEAITHLVDATHPFAAQMSANAVAACDVQSVPLLALTRPPWRAESADIWTHAADIEAAVASLSGPHETVFLAIGRMHIAHFAAQPQHRYILRLIDPPATPPPLPDHHIVIDRGPFTVEGDTQLMKAHGVRRVVAKNAGGSAARAKLDAARALGVPVTMIDRPAPQARREVYTVSEVMNWLAHEGTERGV